MRNYQAGEGNMEYVVNVTTSDSIVFKHVDERYMYHIDDRHHQASLSLCGRFLPLSSFPSALSILGNHSLGLVIQSASKDFALARLGVTARLTNWLIELSIHQVGLSDNRGLELVFSAFLHRYLAAVSGKCGKVAVIG
jgi:hypothetical protein